MTRYDDLRRMREAKFAAVEKKRNESEAAPVTPIKMKPVTSGWGGKRKGAGRAKTGNALSAAERQRRYRARRKPVER